VRSAASAPASEAFPARNADSAKVKCTMSRWAWLPPNRCAFARIGVMSATASA
jgi:hypothetical protein